MHRSNRAARTGGNSARVVRSIDSIDPTCVAIMKCAAPSIVAKNERGRYLLLVDRQTKNSYTTPEAAQTAALAIKKAHPIVQVSVYDGVDNTHMIVELPAASL
jgi:hypothetical protein